MPITQSYQRFPESWTFTPALQHYAGPLPDALCLQSIVFHPFLLPVFDKSSILPRLLFPLFYALSLAADR